MKSLDFELDFWDADGWFPQTEIMTTAFEAEDLWEDRDLDMHDSLSLLLHRRPPIDRVLVS